MRRFSILVLLLATPAAFAADAHRFCGTSLHGSRNAIAAHQEQEERRGPRAAAAADVSASQDVGQIAVLQDEGDLALMRNALDLQGAGLQFSPTGSGYAVARVDRPIVATAGTSLGLTDDSNVSVSLPFAFAFYGTSYTSLFVNSDGNLSFGEGESASTARSLGRFLDGPPRIAGLFADLDPGSAGASLQTASEGDAFVVTWRDVPQFGKLDKNTFQITLFRDGRIAFAFDAALTLALDEGVVGIAPGRGASGFAGVDLSAAAGQTSAGALAEGFRQQTELDLVAVARKFYRSHADNYQQLVIFTNQTLIRPLVFAFEINVKNTDSGTGVVVEDRASSYGSAGRLESVVMMDTLSKYFDDPSIYINGEDSSLSLLGHEVGHRWLAQASFSDGGTASRELLGRDGVHWSFFMNSDASHDEGNYITDLGGGEFRTLGASLRYGPLDQYLMGIRRPEEVPPFFVVRNPVGTVTSPSRAPASGVQFRGTRKDVSVGDVIAAMGPRNPPAGPLAPPFRQAFVYVSVGATADGEQVAKLDRIRQQWEPFFQASSGGRRSVDSRLQ